VIEELYQKNLLRLAADATGDGVMAGPDSEETLDNPTCGDRITVQVKLDGDRILAINHQNRSCVLCQAAASLLGENAAGRNIEEIRQTRSTLQAMLNKEDVSTSSNWEKLDFFRLVAEHKSRHVCVLLPFDALINAVENNNKKD